NNRLNLQRLPAIIPVALLDVRLPDDPDDSYRHIAVNKPGVIEYLADDPYVRTALHILLHHYEQQHAVSRQRNWRRISGWQRTRLGLLPVADNQDLRAYAEPHGLWSPAEDFITAAEHYILPPAGAIENTIKCRMPLKYAFMQNVFTGFRSPLATEAVKCRSQSDGMLDDIVFFDPRSGKTIQPGPINEQTVTGFELLYATPGTGDASEIAGHLLLRIKLDNNPVAKQQGRENPNDLVISFMANTRNNKPADQTPRPMPVVQQECQKGWFDSPPGDQSPFEILDTILQSLQGLSGGFLTMMDRQTLGEAVKHYTIEEDRDLLRYKLNLTPQQKRSLLDELYRAKKNYNTSYYFFDKNCASVLVKVIGKGIAAREIADFNPVVSPPNSLVALFIRQGLAEPVRPAFYSYRKKGYLAQELIRERHRQLQTDYPALTWPPLYKIFSRDRRERADFVDATAVYVGRYPALDTQLYQLFTLTQEAEMAFEHKDLICTEYTSQVTAKSRQHQQTLLQTATQHISPIDTERLFAELHTTKTAEAYRAGTPHTKLLAYHFGVGQYAVEQTSSPVLLIGATLDEQELGSISNVAMQRSSYVNLASTQVILSTDQDHPRQLQSLRFNALDIRKFKDRLNRVPGYFSPAGSTGLGISLLNVEKNYLLDIESGAWLGGELLFNLISGEEHNDFLYFSIGADIRRFKQGNLPAINAIALPLRIETLWTPDERRRLQWRNKLEYRYSTDDELGDEIEAQSGLTYQLGEAGGQLLLLRLQG
ncbi:MAG: DUF4105 domain-containing protein, partial [Gammaproteobacteria bacterium]|nr:DUF4105 domain-containing protein [Gammaproteobacteria bacterium]